VRRLFALLITLDALVLVGLVRPLRFASHFPGAAVSLFYILGITGGAIVRYTVLVLLLVAVFLACCRLIDQVPLRWRAWVIIGGAALLAFSFLLLYPATSNDLFHYAMEARILWVHHANPFTHAPDQYSADRFYGTVSEPTVVWQNLPSPYGPIWVLLGGLPLLFGHGDPFWTYIGFKLLALAFYGLCGFFIFRIVRLLRPGREYRATLLFAWNPLVLMYVAGNGANDIIMMGLTLLALWLALRSQWNLALPALMLATLMKFVSAVLFPLFVFYALLTTPRERWRSLLTPLCFSAGMALLIYAPFWRGTDTFQALKFQSNQFTDSLPALVVHTLSGHFGLGPWDYYAQQAGLRTEVLAKTFAYTLFAFAYAYIGWGLFKRRAQLHADDLAVATFGVVCAYLMLAVLWFQPWYLLWLIPLGALTAGVRTRITLLFTLTGLLTHSATAYAALKGTYYYHPTWEVLTVAGTVFVLPGLYIAYIAASRTRRGRAVVTRIRSARERMLDTIAQRPDETPLVEV
jgi:hypothetical protein